jgi:glyceraldehyde-3-phosphate dehydrogenase/erythrose-4-phosphate dehydrogenase
MTPLKTEFFGRIGKTLLEIQLAEAQLQICLSYFLPPDDAKTVEEIEAQAEADRRKTLGDLVTLMRKRIVVSEDFNKKLTQFVQDRNALAHRFLRVEIKGATCSLGGA